jgi:hypothetical protein
MFHAAMECLYRQYLLLPVAVFDCDIGDWTASVHIEFTEKLKVHTVVLKSGDAFKSDVQARNSLSNKPNNGWMIGLAVDPRSRRGVNASHRIVKE